MGLNKTMFGNTYIFLFSAVISVAVIGGFFEALVSPITCNHSWVITNSEVPKPSFSGMFRNFLRLILVLSASMVPMETFDLNTNIIKKGVLFYTFTLSVVMTFSISFGYLRFLPGPRIIPQYRYSPLSQKSDVVRLLRLLPCQDEEVNIRCELFEYTLRELESTNCPYEALSYVWGGENKPRSITIDGRELAITENLHTVLLRLQDRVIPRIIWVDAVCINQADDKEKEYQIPLLPTIYAKASRVIVWLGEAYDDSYQALESIRLARENVIKPSNIEIFQQPIRQLLNRPWFNRIWVSN
jgi:hypothetical protein